MAHSSLLKLHFAVLLFGAAGLMGKIIDLPASWLVLGRTGFGALALGCLLSLLWYRSSHAKPLAKSLLTSAPINIPLKLNLISSSIVLAIHWWAFFYGIQQAGVGITLVGFSSFPVFVMALEISCRIRQVSTNDLWVTGLVVVGLWWVAPTFAWQDQALQGLTYGIIAGALFALLTLQNKMLIKHFNGLTMGFWQQAVAALCCVLWLFIDPTTSLVHQPITPQHWWLLGLLGICLTALPHVLFIYALQKVSAHMAAIASSLEPVYGIAFAWLVIAEQPQLSTLAGMAIIVVAVLLNIQLQKSA